MENLKQKNRITWDTYLKNIAFLGNLVESANLHNHQFVGILRGGAIPATILSYRFKQRPIMLNVVSYNRHSQEKALINPKEYGQFVKHKNILLIDDLIDSGETMLVVTNAIKAWAPENCCKSAVVYSKQIARQINPSVFARAWGDEWIYFPYDAE